MLSRNRQTPDSAANRNNPGETAGEKLPSTNQLINGRNRNRNRNRQARLARTDQQASLSGTTKDRRARSRAGQGLARGIRRPQQKRERAIAAAGDKAARRPKQQLRQLKLITQARHAGAIQQDKPRKRPSDMKRGEPQRRRRNRGRKPRGHEIQLQPTATAHLCRVAANQAPNQLRAATLPEL